jgi:hypothetical protein
MTVPFYPGPPTGYPQQGYQQPLPPMQPGVHTTQVQQQPSFGYPQPMYPVAPQQPPQGPPVQPQFQQPAGADMNQRVWGPGVPPELQGKTVGEAMRYYGIMRQDFITRQQPPAPQQQSAPQGQPQPSQQQGFQSAQPRPQHQPQHDQIDPIRQAVNEALAPIVGPIQQQNLLGTYNSVKGRFADWQHYEHEILGSMQGADQSIVTNPASWEAAYYHAKGRRLSQPQQGQQPGQQFQSQQGGPQFSSQNYPVPQQQGWQPPQPGGGQTFVEGPTPAAPGMSPQQFDPRDESFARRFNVPVEVYRSWKGGRFGMMPQPQVSSFAQPQIPTQQLQPQYQQPQQQMGFQPFQPQVPSYATPFTNGGGNNGF